MQGKISLLSGIVRFFFSEGGECYISRTRKLLGWKQCELDMNALEDLKLETICDGTGMEAKLN